MDQVGRAQEYLFRIQDFYFRPTSARELTLWPILASSLGLGVTASLLPALKSLTVDLCTVNEIGWVRALLLLISPTLKRISYVSSSTHAPDVDFFHRALLELREPRLVHVAYCGYPSSGFLQSCLLFDHLESLSLEFKFEGQNIRRYTGPPITVVDIFQKLGNLRDLRIDLRVLTLRSPGSVGNRTSPASSNVLRTLHIAGDAGDLQDFLTDGLTSTSVHSISVLITGAEGLVWKALYDQAVSSFPHIRNLSTEVAPNVNAPQLLMSDLSSIISLPPFEAFRLGGVYHGLTDADIISLANSWPELRVLTICDEYRVFFTSAVLIELSKSSHHLYELALPLDLLDLERAFPFDDPTGNSPRNCPLRELVVTRFYGIPSTLQEKFINLKVNMVSLFPVLNKVSTGDIRQQKYFDGLQAFVESYHRITAMRDHSRALSKAMRNPGLRWSRPRIAGKVTYIG